MIETLELRCKAKFDRDDNGKLRKTKTGMYRFSLIIHDEQGAPFLVAKGFRFDPETGAILPPTIKLEQGPYPVCTLSQIANAELLQDLNDFIKLNRIDS